MWARVVEFMLACWLSISPFVFRYPDEATFFWANDLTCSSLIAIFALISYRVSLRKMHLCNLIIAIYLIALSYFLQSSTYYEALQNYMVLGILLLMIAIIPTHADKPPKAWQDYYK